VGWAVERAGPAHLRLRGPLTFANAAQVWAHGQRELAATAGNPIEIDCSGIEAVDSAALAVLVEWLGWGHRHGRAVRLQGVPEKLLQIARISELDDLIRPD
jgi:phospholipid transport system transporter-binding protein